MTDLLPIDDIDRYVSTRESWHAVAEHVLAAARHRAVGRIGLRVHAGGFGTPHFGDDEQLWVDRAGIHHAQFGEVREAPIDTLRTAAEFAGIEPGAPEAVFTPTTTIPPDAPLVVDDAAVAVLSHWFEFAESALQELRGAHADDTPSLVQLWPEHFDLAVDFGAADVGQRANYGASPGDAAIPEPYLYVGPWDTSRIADDPFWNQPWGTALTYRALLAAPDPRRAASSFFAHGHLRLHD